MSTFIRLTDYKSSDEKEEGFFKSENRYVAKQEDFEKIPGSPIAYWVSDKMKGIFQSSKTLAEIIQPRVGFSTGDNDRFLKYWNEIEFCKIGFNLNDRNEAKVSKYKWFPHSKGGGFRKWYGNDEYVVNWENDGYELRNFFDYKGKLRSRPQNLDFMFLSGITWGDVGTEKPSFRFQVKGNTANARSPMLYLDSFSLMAFLNSKISINILETISPTITFNVGEIAKLPIIFAKQELIKQTIDTLTQECINISKEEWDSRETSWDFRANPLLEMLNVECSMLNEENNSKFKIQNLKLESVYNRYCEYWKEKFYKLHSNEEELNRLFIDIYELQDELTPEVELKDITILKQEADIVDGKLVFNADEIMKQFISYAVGVMFGRYSLDHEGLHVANMHESLEDTNSKFEADDDNIIPVLSGEYFTDDIASRFTEFVKTTFGQEHLQENMRFIETSLGMDIRKYFVKGFYEDHIKRYKKRPIYWMVSSPKKSFMALLYMHRYSDDIFARVQNSYLREYIAKLEAAILEHQRIADDATNSTTQRTKAAKEVESMTKAKEECIAFDRQSLSTFAQTRTPIDLDDGVKVNYCKFADILYPISGLCK